MSPPALHVDLSAFDVDGNIWNAPCENEPTPGLPICLVIVYISLAEIDDIDAVQESAAGRASGILAWGRLPSRWRMAAGGRGGLGSQNDLVDQVPRYPCLHVSMYHNATPTSCPWRTAAFPSSAKRFSAFEFSRLCLLIELPIPSFTAQCFTSAASR
jgi:hypothetical protein